MKVEKAAKQLEALGNPTRLQLYRALVRAGDGGLPVGRLQDKLDRRLDALSPPASADPDWLGHSGASGDDAHLPRQLSRDEQPCRVSGRRMLPGCRMRREARRGRRLRPRFFDAISMMPEGWNMGRPAFESLPVAVIGGGPVGLAAAAHLMARGLPVKVYEAGPAVGSNVRDWGTSASSRRGAIASTRLRPRCSIVKVGGCLLPTLVRQEPNWSAPIWNRLPPLPSWQPSLKPTPASPRFRGTASTRWSAPGAGAALCLDGGMGERSPRSGARGGRRVRYVGDAESAGASGLPAVGEAEFADRIAYGIPDILGRDRHLYAGRKTLVVGSGHSAANALLELAQLAKDEPRTSLLWATRSVDLARIYSGGDADQLPARGELGANVRELVDRGRVKLTTGFAILRSARKRAIVVEGETAKGLRWIGPVDRIIAATGQRPDLSLTRELRLDLDPWLESAKALGPLIDPNVHSCGSVPPHGHRELSHPEPGFYTVGIKSYGRAPTFAAHRL